MASGSSRDLEFLVVDDDPMCSTLLEDMILSLGHKAEAKCSCEEGFAALSEQHWAEHSYHTARPPSHARPALLAQLTGDTARHSYFWTGTWMA